MPGGGPPYGGKVCVRRLRDGRWEVRHSPEGNENGMFILRRGAVREEEEERGLGTTRFGDPCAD